MMDVEARILLYLVCLGSGAGMVQIVRRRAYPFWAHFSLLTTLLGLSVAGIARPAWLDALAVPTFAAFLAFSMAPSLLLLAARRLSAQRRNAWSAPLAWVGSALLLFAAPVRREALLYSSLAAAERGDEAACARRMERLAALRALPEGSGGAQLARVFPPAVGRRWHEVLSVLDREGASGSTILVLEARAAAETGDLRRALRAASVLASQVPSASPLLRQARRAVLCAAGRASFLAEAGSLRLPVVAGPAGTLALALARAHEARGDAAEALRLYREVATKGASTLGRDAAAGLERCETGRLLTAAPDEIETGQLQEMEERCRQETPLPAAGSAFRSAPATVTLSAVTTLASLVALAVAGIDAVSLLSVGALSAPLVRFEGEWWRLGTAMLLHGGWVHLTTNIASILLIGIPLEKRCGPSRTVILYVVSGLLASLASVHLNDTPVGVGASGAAMGLVGAFLVLLYRCPALFTYAERARWLRLIWIAVLATAVLGVAEYRAFDNAAHGGGLVAGAVLMGLLLPGRQPGPSHHAARRLFATLLAGALGFMTALAVPSHRRWTSEQEVVAGRARVRLPGWLKGTVTSAEGWVGARPPLEIGVQVGQSPGNDPELRTVVDPGLLEALGAPEAAGQGIRHGAMVTRSRMRPDGRAPAETPGALLVEVRRGEAFVLFAVPDTEEDAQLLEPLVERAAATLRGE